MRRNNYKLLLLKKSMENIRKRGQATIFIIVAIVIVVLIALFFLFRPRIEGIFESEFSPHAYLKACIEPEIKPAVETLANQGGYQEPEGFVLSNGKKVQYLCYTNEYYKTCTIQQPMTKAHFEKELNLMLKAKSNQCMNKMIAEYKDRGYDIKTSSTNSEVSIIPSKILVSFSSPMTVTKETVQTFKGFDVEIKSEMYDLLFIAQSIVEYESKLGDSASELYLQYYPNLKIEKFKLSDGSTLYQLSDVITNEKFKFASRSLAWPAGYGLDEKVKGGVV